MAIAGAETKSEKMESKPPAAPPAGPTLLHRLINLDTAASLHLYTFFQPILPFSLLKSLELSGDGRLFFPITLSILAAATTTTHAAPITVLLNLLIGSLLDLILIGLIKHIVQRPRPVYNKHMFLSFAVDHWSFPSGHSSRVSFIAVFCFFYCDRIRDDLLVHVLNFEAESGIVKYFVLMVGVWAAITSVSRGFLEGISFLMFLLVGFWVLLKDCSFFGFLITKTAAPGSDDICWNECKLFSVLSCDLALFISVEMWFSGSN